MASRPGSEAQLLAVYDRIRDSAAAPPLSQRGQGQDVGVLKGWLCPFDIAINRLRDRVRLAPQATHFARMRVGPLGDRLQDAPGRPSWPRSTTAATWSGRRFAWSTETWRLLRSAPRVARSCGPNRWRRSTTGPRPSHRHLPATRRPDDKFYLGYRPGRGRVFTGPRLMPWYGRQRIAGRAD